MSWYSWLKWLHILSSTVLFGTGAGMAFFLVRAVRSGDVRVIAAVSREVVRRHYRSWFGLGWPAFPGVTAVFHRMAVKPQ